MLLKLIAQWLNRLTRAERRRVTEWLVPFGYFRGSNLFSPPSNMHSWRPTSINSIGPEQMTTWHLGMRKNLPPDLIRQIWNDAMRPPPGYVFSAS